MFRCVVCIVSHKNRRETKELQVLVLYSSIKVLDLLGLTSFKTVTQPIYEKEGVEARKRSAQF